MYENESVTPLARLGKADNAPAKAKLSKTLLVDFITFETESEKSTVSDRMAETSLCSVIEPLKIPVSESEMVGLSVSPLNPVKILSMTSDGVGASDRNLPADLLMPSEIVDRSSANPLNMPWETMSEMAGFSVSPLNPLKT